MALLMSSVLVAGCAGVDRAKRTVPSTVVASEGLPFAIRRVAVEPKTIDVRLSQEVTIQYELTHPANVVIDIVDEDGVVVRRLREDRQEAGPHQMRWDGRDTNEARVASGVYRYSIRADSLVSSNRQSVTYDPSTDTGGEELSPRDFVWDAAANRFRWIMPKAARARLRVGLNEFPHLRTLLDWEPLEGGAQELAWDGLDASGLIRVEEHPERSVKLVAFALAPNTIIVRGELPDPPTNPLTRRQRRQGFSHADHPRATCHEVRFRVEFPGATADAEGRPQLSGVVSVRVWLDEREAVHLVNERFDIMLFVDLTIIVEEGEGSNPYTYLWDTTHIPPGPHLLTVNVLGYADHFGVVTQPVLIGSPS